jgi:hypothetical protein
LLDEEGQPLDRDNPHFVTRVGADLASSLPELALDSNLTRWTARRHDARRGTYERLDPHGDAPALREPDPEPELSELDGGGDTDEQPTPRRADDGEREDDGSE